MKVSTVNVLPSNVSNVGSHLRNVTVAVADLSLVAKSHGVNCSGWDKVWVHVVFGGVGTKTCTITPYVWQPCDVDGDIDNGAWTDFGSSSLSVIEANGGRKSFLVDAYQGILYFRPSAVGLNASFSVFVQGAVRALVL